MIRKRLFQDGFKMKNVNHVLWEEKVRSGYECKSYSGEKFRSILESASCDCNSIKLSVKLPAEKTAEMKKRF